MTSEAEWRTDEPQEGEVAWLNCNGEKFGPVICGISDIGNKIWRSAHLFWSIYDPDFKGWLPITTPEEERLRARVRELEEKKRQLKILIEDALPFIETLRDEWNDADWDLSEIDELIRDIKHEAGGG